MHFAAFLATIALGHAAPAASVPLPPHYVIHFEPCPDGGGSCAYRDGRIYLAPGHSRFTHWHELGHIFDFELLTVGDRTWFGRLLLPERGWYAPEGDVSAFELFADAYAACALGLDPRGAWTSSAGYYPAPRLHRRVCSAIRRVGRR